MLIMHGNPVIRAGQLREFLEGEDDEAIIMVEFGNYLKAAKSITIHQSDGVRLIALTAPDQANDGSDEAVH